MHRARTYLAHNIPIKVAEGPIVKLFEPTTKNRWSFGMNPLSMKYIPAGVLGLTVGCQPPLQEAPFPIPTIIIPSESPVSLPNETPCAETDEPELSVSSVNSCRTKDHHGDIDEFRITFDLCYPQSTSDRIDQTAMTVKLFDRKENLISYYGTPKMSLWKRGLVEIPMALASHVPIKIGKIEVTLTTLDDDNGPVHQWEFSFKKFYSKEAEVSACPQWLERGHRFP